LLGIKGEANFSIIRSLNKKLFIIPFYFLKIGFYAGRIYVDGSGSADPDDLLVSTYTYTFSPGLTPLKKYVDPGSPTQLSLTAV
jgi:hypothetical protein